MPSMEQTKTEQTSPANSDAGGKGENAHDIDLSKESFDYKKSQLEDNAGKSSSGGEGNSGENVRDIDLSKESFDFKEKLLEDHSSKSSQEIRDKESQNWLDSAADGRENVQEGKSEKLNEIKENSQEYQDPQREKANETQKWLDDVSDK